MNWRNSIFKKNQNYFVRKGYHFYAEAPEGEWKGCGSDLKWSFARACIYIFFEEQGLTYSQHSHLSRLDRNFLRFSLLRDARSSHALQNNVASLIFARKYQRDINFSLIACNDYYIKLIQFSFSFRAEKEKSKFQQELFELMSQVESANKDRVRSHYRLLMNRTVQLFLNHCLFFQATYVKQVEKLELHVHEYTLKVEELNRTIIDISSHKTRLYTFRQRFIYNLLKENDHNKFIWSTGKH